MPNKKAAAAFMLAAALCIPCFSLERSSDLYKQGASLAMKGDIDGAIEKFRKAVEAGPYYCLAHYGLGKAYLYKYGMIDEAIIHLRESVMLDRKLARGHFYLGMAYLLKRNYVYAVHSFKAAYEADDSMIEALYNIGVAYDMMGKDYNAVIYFRKYYAEKNNEGGDSLF
ncbi:MAG TPA: tetratricopeptide repeat protein [Spirochaetota bacterium]|nr:tetratricopeptide repeat protein [Spirochaetota bacterium]HSA14092.1 tetratricopeptide repeat protein [Spirochaetota bacterium]